MDIEFKATKVFQETWDAVTATFINALGKSERKYKIIEQVGGSRSSKTWSDFQVIFLYGYYYQFKEIVVMRDTAVDCRDKVEREFIKWLRDPMSRMTQFENGEITAQELDHYLVKESLIKYFDYHGTTHVWTFKHNKSSISFTGTDDPNRSIGKSQSVLWVNEPYKFNEEVFIQLTQRTSDFVLVDWNPKEDHFIERQRFKNDTITLRSTLLDNPFCPIQTKKQVLGYQPISMCDLVKSSLLTIEEAQVYDTIVNEKSFTDKQCKELARCQNNARQKTESAYHWSVYGLGEKAEKPNRIFSFKEIPDDEYMKLSATEYVACDWGSVDPWAIVAAKYYDGCLYFKELNYSSENEIRSRMTSTQLEQIKGDEEGIVRWMFRKLNIDKSTTIVCDSNRPEKIRSLRAAGWDYSISATKGKGSIIDGIDVLSNIDVFFTASSKNFKNEQENYSRKTDRYGTVLEEPEDLNNHLMDAARYIAMFLKREGIIKSV